MTTPTPDRWTVAVLRLARTHRVRVSAPTAKEAIDRAIRELRPDWPGWAGAAVSAKRERDKQ